ncbi:MAG: T9SS type A sorting domain-containing protein, partial [Bacteroidales bacterium]|nr:T9SS type A sorting domain-containing protein [Bacteroidales bacterium]
IVASFTTVPETTSLVTDTFVSIEAGQSIVFTNTSTNADHIVWSFLGGDPATSTDDEVTVTYTTIGSYTARLDAYNADETVSDNTSIVVLVTTPTSISDSENEEINVYPNPTSSILNIVANGMQNIAIIDMNGREVLSRNVNGNSESIDIENLAKAQYIVRITTDNGTILRNVIVE